MYVYEILTEPCSVWFSGVASPPGRPVVELSSRISAPEEDSVTDEVNLTWGVPEDDGGYPITGFRFRLNWLFRYSRLDLRIMKTWDKVIKMHSVFQRIPIVQRFLTVVNVTNIIIRANFLDQIILTQYTDKLQV